MPTTRFCAVIGVPERTWRRWQARARTGAAAKGPWPRPARDRVREAARRHALAHPAWGHRKVWAMCRHDGLAVSQASVLRLVRDEGLLLEKRTTSVNVGSSPPGAVFAVEPTRSWIKTAVRRTHEVVVAGWFPGSGSRRESLGSLALGAYDEHGVLVYVGDVGTGFTTR